MISLLLTLLPIFLDIFKMVKGTPEDKREALLENIRKSTENFKTTGNTSDLGKL